MNFDLNIFYFNQHDFRLDVARLMLELIDLCRTRAFGDDERQEKGLEVEKCGERLLQAWKKISQTGASFYMHAAYHHLPEQIRTLPVDIIDASGESFEAKNQQLKRILRR